MKQRFDRALLAISAMILVAAAGCGLAPAPGGRQVTLTVTQGFGARAVGTVIQRGVSGSETVLGMLRRSFSVQTRPGGGVRSIDNLTGDSEVRRWSYYVNGVEATQGAAASIVHYGDRIWWDLHDFSQTYSVPAVVGSFPEPFVHGVGGKRLPTVMECAPGAGDACSRVGTQLKAAGVPVASQLLGTGSGTDSLGVLVGTWAQLRPTIVGALIARGPGRSGIYARFAGAAGGSLQLLDPRGRVVRTLRAGAGLVAATRDSISEPVWLITGTDRSGVAAAASALVADQLRDHFALAVQGDAAIPVPVSGGT